MEASQIVAGMMKLRGNTAAEEFPPFPSSWQLFTSVVTWSLGLPSSHFHSCPAHDIGYYCCGSTCGICFHWSPIIFTPILDQPSTQQDYLCHKSICKQINKGHLPEQLWSFLCDWKTTKNISAAPQPLEQVKEFVTVLKTWISSLFLIGFATLSPKEVSLLWRFRLITPSEIYLGSC